MKDGVKLSESGGSLGFPVKSTIIKALKLKYKDPVEFDILDENGNVIITLQAQLKKNKTIFCSHSLICLSSYQCSKS